MKSSPLTYEFIKDAIHEQNCNIGEIADVCLSVLQRAFPLYSFDIEDDVFGAAQDLNKMFYEMKALLESIKQFGWQIVYFLDAMDVLNNDNSKAGDI